MDVATQEKANADTIAALKMWCLNFRLFNRHRDHRDSAEVQPAECLPDHVMEAMRPDHAPAVTLCDDEIDELGRPPGEYEPPSGAAGA